VPPDPSLRGFVRHDPIGRGFVARELPSSPGGRAPGLSRLSWPYPGSHSSRLAGVSLSIGIVGLPNVGKSTLFNALTRASALAANYPFATIEPNVGVVGVPDARLGELAKLYDSARIVPASVRFTDIAGLVRGASKGEGLGNQFLAHIRETDAICQVVRVFTDPDVTHVDGDVSPERDIETIATELILADLQTLEKALPRLAKETKFSKDPERLQVAQSAAVAQQVLDRGSTLSAAARTPGSGFTDADLAAVRELQLLTAKPFLYVFNSDLAELADDDLRKRLTDLVAPAESVFLDAKTEADLAELPEDEAAELLAEAGLGEPGLAQLARAGFRALGLQTFLTAGPKESRAWEIKQGATAPEAAGVIHTDFQRGFIKAEVVSYDDLIAAGSVAAARAAGKARIEGKEYIMQDGDVVEFRHS
jgi:GTP-binding protein YchF